MTKKISFKILFIAFSASVIILLISIMSPEFADFFSLKIASRVRLALSAFSSLFPFSLFETFILTLLIFLLFYIICGIAFIFKRNRLFLKMTRLIIVLAMIIIILFVFTLAACYHRPPLFSKLELDIENVSSADVGDTLEYLVEKINAEVKKLKLWRFYSSSSLSGYSFNEMASYVNSALDKLCNKYPFLQEHGFPAKAMSLSAPMTYAHISGIYSFFTGESNVNINYPEYIVVYAMAHEYAHQRGIGAENEANFIAFLTCMESNIPYVRYSGLANMIYSLWANYYLLDPQACQQIMSALDKSVYNEYLRYSEFFEEYSKSPLYDISSEINDSYLKLNGESKGIESYNDITLLITAYYKKYCE